jgi:hypothetical protein
VEATCFVVLICYFLLFRLFIRKSLERLLLASLEPKYSHRLPDEEP